MDRLPVKLEVPWLEDDGSVDFAWKKTVLWSFLKGAGAFVSARHAGACYPQTTGRWMLFGLCIQMAMHFAIQCTIWSRCLKMHYAFGNSICKVALQSSINSELFWFEWKLNQLHSILPWFFSLFIKMAMQFAIGHSMCQRNNAPSLMHLNLHVITLFWSKNPNGIAICHPLVKAGSCANSGMADWLIATWPMKAASNNETAISVLVDIGKRCQWFIFSNPTITF